MSYETLATFILATAVIVAIPGPNILIVINDSINHGFKRSLATNFRVDRKSDVKG